MTINNVTNRASINSANPPSTENTTENTTTSPETNTAAGLLNADGIENKPSHLKLDAQKPEVKLSPAGQKKAEAAINKFNNTLESVMNRGHKNRAMALADAARGGKQPYGPGDKLDPADVETLKTAAKDLAMDMPIGALSPGAQKKIEGALQGTSFELKDVQNKSLNELKSELGDRAEKVGKEIADGLKANKPGLYYGLGAAGAAAAGVYAYKEGSGALEKLGITPEFKSSFFGDKVNAKAKGSWEAEMKNPNLALDLNTKLKTSEHGRLAFGAKANIGGSDLANIGFKGGSGNLGYTHTLGQGNSLAANVSANFNASGEVTSGRSELKYNSDAFKLGLGAKHGEKMDVLGYDLKGNFKLSDNTSASTNLNFDRKFKFEKGTANLSHNFEANHSLNINSNFDSKGFNDISAKYIYRKNNWDVGAGVKHNFLTDRTSANISAGYNVRDNFSVGILGSTDGGSNHSLGLGLSYSF
ncbi:MAG: hypothetical protein CMH56_04690 [Myxococcales bacterium]|nr:hypothetical protein [Myxococcales bacterium]